MAKVYIPFSSSLLPMKRKNVLLVMVVILTPIIILGALAMSGAEQFAEKKKTAEGAHTTEAIMPMESVAVDAALPLSYHFTGMALTSAV